MRLVSVMDRTALVALEPEELMVMAEAMRDAWELRENATRGKPGEQTHLLLLDSWAVMFKSLAMAAAACSYISEEPAGGFSLKTVERDTGEKRRRRRRAA